MQLPFATLDVFTSTRLEGNPLAVVSVPASRKAELTQAKKQKIAQEFNLSETVFMHQPPPSQKKDGDGGEEKENKDASQVQIDIFTTESELPFAGHPTIGSAVLARFHWYPAVDTLLTKSGPIHLDVASSSSSSSSGKDKSQGQGQSVRARISHDVRLHQKTLADVIPADRHGSYPGLSHHLPAVRAAELAAPVFSIVRGMTFALVQLPSLDLLGGLDRGLRLDFDNLPGGPLLDEDRHPAGFVARYYYVDQGNDDGVRKLRTRMMELGFEDPATGSAASALAAYLAVAGRSEHARFEITQGVEMGRRSVIQVETRADVQQQAAADGKKKEGEVQLRELWLGGEAVVVQYGTLVVD
ncbi:phenazine biosynthesis protein phzf protein [Apiospora rasikravindrae]|uniref:Phenazine biosynthesis protein phzf protein n=1 Tax=Apiospora rasikravindrae TaxID=990691 RepID=A0ABR1TZG8_9PEZI